MAKLFPTLRYRDPKAPLDWLEKALQFQRHFVAEEGNQIESQRTVHSIFVVSMIRAEHGRAVCSREFSCKDLEGHVWSFATYTGEPVS